MKPLTNLALNVAVPVILALALNGVIFALGWTQPDHDRQPSFAPPGYAIGIVWTILFACMGAARYYAVAAGDRRDAALIVILIALCLAYPFYTAGLQDHLAGLIGLSVTEVLALTTLLHAWKPARWAAYLILPLIVWLWFASLLILATSRLNA